VFLQALTLREPLVRERPDDAILRSEADGTRQRLTETLAHLEPSGRTLAESREPGPVQVP
jgi:hypothetical protein